MSKKFIDTMPIYLQIIEMIKVDIISGKYKKGDKLPAVRYLAIEYGVNPNTVQRAYAELERDGLVESERTSGRFVSAETNILDELKNNICDQHIQSLFENLNLLGLSDSEIKKLVDGWEEK